VAHDAAPTVTRNDEKHRYEIHVDGTVAGFTEFEVDASGRTVLPHTVIDPAFEGRGLGKILVAGTLADLARREDEIVPRCPFVVRYLGKNDVPGLKIARRSRDAE
jgi:predicted GNAT family acetyltransferase